MRSLTRITSHWPRLQPLRSNPHRYTIDPFLSNSQVAPSHRTSTLTAEESRVAYPPSADVETRKTRCSTQPRVVRGPFASLGLDNTAVWKGLCCILRFVQVTFRMFSYLLLPWTFFPLHPTLSDFYFGRFTLEHRRAPLTPVVYVLTVTHVTAIQ